MQSKLKLTALCMMLSLSLGGCSVLDLFVPKKSVYAPPGASAEVAKASKIEVWITNKATGEKQKRVLEVQSGWYIVRPKIEPFGE